MVQNGDRVRPRDEYRQRKRQKDHEGKCAEQQLLRRVSETELFGFFHMQASLSSLLGYVSIIPCFLAFVIGELPPKKEKNSQIGFTIRAFCVILLSCENTYYQFFGGTDREMSYLRIYGKSRR